MDLTGQPRSRGLAPRSGGRGVSSLENQLVDGVAQVRDGLDVVGDELGVLLTGHRLAVAGDLVVDEPARSGVDS